MLFSNFKLNHKLGLVSVLFCFHMNLHAEDNCSALFNIDQGNASRFLPHKMTEEISTINPENSSLEYNGITSFLIEKIGTTPFFKTQVISNKKKYDLPTLFYRMRRDNPEFSEAQLNSYESLLRISNWETMASKNNIDLTFMKFKKLKWEDMQNNLLFFNQKTGVQIIRPASDEEQQLILESEVNSNPHEMMRLSYMDNQGRYFTKKNLIVGEMLKVGSQNEIRNLLKKAQHKGIIIYEFIVSHTHPFYEVKINNTFYQMNTLSPGDHQVTQGLSLEFPDIRMKIIATVPNGYSYEATYLNGQRIE